MGESQNNIPDQGLRPDRYRFGHWWITVPTGVLVLGVLALLGVYLVLRGSLPQTGGTIRLPGLAKMVVVTRDAQGIPTIIAADELDAWRALGYVEAQDRYIQMDILRRLGGGNLAALVGPGALALDRRRVAFGLRARAEQIYLDAIPGERARLEAFALGVNEGLGRLAVKPWPYFLLRNTPKPWRPADSILVVYAMGFILHPPWNPRSRSLAALRALYPPVVVRFLMSADTRWAAPMVGTVPGSPPVPGSRAINFAAGTPARPGVIAPAPASGSNSFAVAGTYTHGGLPLLANDMHLALAVPPVWYRARIEFPERQAPHYRVILTGVFLPGLPVLVAGNNGHIAWGLTNSGGDWSDLIRVRLKPGDPSTYVTPDGPQPLVTERTLIRVHGKKPVSVEIEKTRWGPVIGGEKNGSVLVAHWSLAQPGGVNLSFMYLETARRVSQALKIAARSGIPAQNFLVVDRAGHLGWTIAGRIPSRIGGCDYAVPESWASGQCGWQGWLPGDAYPRIVDPPSGFLATANNRVDASAAGAVLGSGRFVDGARAHQIAADLMRLVKRGEVVPKDLLGIQLDDQAVFLARWQRLALSVLRRSALEFHPRRRAFRETLTRWKGRAAVNSVAYRLVRNFRITVAATVFAPILRRLRRRYPGARLPFSNQLEGPLWNLIKARPKNWLNPLFPTWNALFLYAIDKVTARLWKSGSGFTKATWGRRNTVRVDSFFSRALGPFGSWLNMPVLELPGDRFMPRVQTPNFGASMRLVTAPGTSAAAAILELPGGETDNPLSPWYGDEFMAWAKGEPMPLIPGRALTHLRFVPWLRLSAAAKNRDITDAPPMRSGP